MNAIRNYVYRPGLRAARQLLGGVVFFREPVSVAADRSLATNFNTLHPAEVIDLREPVTGAPDAFLASCQYIEHGLLHRPAIFVCEMTDVKLYPRLGLVFSRRWSPVLESILDLGRFFNFRRLVRPRRFFNFRRLVRPRRVTRRAGTFSSVQHIFADNHWHWTVDSLAQVWSLERFMAGRSLTLLMPDSLPMHQREYLEMLLPVHFAVEYVAAETYVECERFVLPSYVSGRADAHLPAEYFTFLRERVFAGLGVPKPVEREGRLYVSRSRAAHRRVRNESEVLGILEPLGFRCLWMEDHTFAEQVGMMRAAECVISPHGAGLGCMIYGDALKVGVLYPEARPAGYFYTLARGLGHRHFQTNSDVLEDSDFEVDLVQLRQMLAEMDLLAP